MSLVCSLSNGDTLCITEAYPRGQTGKSVRLTNPVSWGAIVSGDVQSSQACLTTAKKWSDTVSIWTVLFIILLIAWIGGFTVFHVAGAFVHILLILAFVSLILHFVTGRRTA